MRQEHDFIHLLNGSKSSEEIWGAEEELHGPQRLKEKREFIFISAWIFGKNPARNPPPPISVELITHILPFWGLGLHVSIATDKCGHQTVEGLAMSLYQSL